MLLLAYARGSVVIAKCRDIRQCRWRPDATGRDWAWRCWALPIADFRSSAPGWPVCLQHAGNIGARGDPVQRRADAAGGSGNAGDRVAGATAVVCNRNRATMYVAAGGHFGCV